MSTRKAVYLPEKFYAILKTMAELDCRPMGQQIGWLLQKEQQRRMYGKASSELSVEDLSDA